MRNLSLPFGGTIRYALAMKQGFPIARPGMTIGLLGGSFDPAHEGHAHVTRAALRKFGLDRVWWLVSPGNPLKAAGPAPIKTRMEHARQVMRDPRVVITDIEARLGTRYTAETLEHLTARYPRVRFVWLMGSDNLVQFDHWDNWQGILGTVPVGVIVRPGSRLRARLSRAARIFRHAQLPEEHARLLPLCEPPAWCMVNAPMNDMSSTRIRASGQWRTQS